MDVFGPQSVRQEAFHYGLELNEGIYRHCPLSPDREIRLLSIDGSEDLDAALNCNMTVASLCDKGTPYQTLSYAWESQKRTRTIWVNGQTMLIAENLFCALKRIRQRQSASAPTLQPIEYLWVDAVCINQEDNAEKTQQVALMSDIYEHSRRLLIWLGEASTVEVAKVKTALRCEDTLQDRKLVLLGLLGRSWFRRRWTVQELLKSPEGKRHFLLGAQRFYPEELAGPLGAVSRCAGQDFASAVAIAAPLTSLWLPQARKIFPLSMMVWKRTSRSSFKFSLFHLLVRLSGMQCSDPKDIIYSLLGLTVDAKDLRPDYDVLFEEVLLTVALRRLRFVPGGGRPYLKSVLLCATAWSPRERPILPSWVPDWSQHMYIASERHGEEVFLSTEFNSEEESSISFQVEQGIAATVAPLQIDGFLLRECGHDGEAGEDRCILCNDLTKIWWLQLPDDTSIFELQERGQGSDNSFKLTGYGGCLDDGTDWRRFEAKNTKAMVKGLLPEELRSRKVSAFSQATRTTVKIR